VEYRPLGSTGLRVSRVGFGGAPLGIPRYLSPEDRSSDEFAATSTEAIRAAIDLGVNYFDTAPGYGGGRDEEILGAALQGHRDQMVIATKYPFRPEQSFAERTTALQ
jgi:aryl-alcohol dehydrogenase-like predicted oxidoreductase